MKKVILSVIVLAAVIGIVEAAPFQTMGLLRTPDAYVIPHKSAQLVLAGYYRNVEKPSYVDMDKNGLNFYGMLGVGLFDRVQLDFFGGDYVYFLNAKVKLLQETPKFLKSLLAWITSSRQSIAPGTGLQTLLLLGSEQQVIVNSPIRDSLNLGWIDHPDKTDYEHFSPTSSPPSK